MIQAIVAKAQAQAGKVAQVSSGYAAIIRTLFAQSGYRSATDADVASWAPAFQRDPAQAVKDLRATLARLAPSATFPPVKPVGVVTTLAPVPKPPAPVMGAVGVKELTPSSPASAAQPVAAVKPASNADAVSKRLAAAVAAGRVTQGQADSWRNSRLSPEQISALIDKADARAPAGVVPKSGATVIAPVPNSRPIIKPPIIEPRTAVGTFPMERAPNLPPTPAKAWQQVAPKPPQQPPKEPVVRLANQTKVAQAPTVAKPATIPLVATRAPAAVYAVKELTAKVPASKRPAPVVTPGAGKQAPEGGATSWRMYLMLALAGGAALYLASDAA